MAIKPEIESGVKNAEAKLVDAKEAAREKYSEAKDSVSNWASNLKEKTAEVKDKVTESFKENAQKLKDKAISTQEAMEECVKNHPWKSIGISVLAGMILTKLLRARK